MRFCLSIVVLMILFSFCSVAYCQEQEVVEVKDSLNISGNYTSNDSDRVVSQIILVDGSELIGKIIGDDGEKLQFQTISNISIDIPKDQIKSITKIYGELVEGEIRRTDLNQTRLFFAPTARPLKSGQGYFSVYQIFFPMIAVGIGDLVSLAGGISLIPFAEGQLIYLAPKITPVQFNNFDLAAGVLYINTTRGGFEGLGIIYSVGTYGTESLSLTTGLGYGYVEGELSKLPVLLIGGEYRLSNNWKLISENWFPPESDFALVSFGVRFFGDRLAADLGFIYPAGTKVTGFPFFPWIGFAYNFGSNK